MKIVLIRNPWNGHKVEVLKPVTVPGYLAVCMSQKCRDYDAIENRQFGTKEEALSAAERHVEGDLP